MSQIQKKQTSKYMLDIVKGGDINQTTGNRSVYMRVIPFLHLLNNLCLKVALLDGPSSFHKEAFHGDMAVREGEPSHTIDSRPFQEISIDTGNYFSHQIIV